MITVLIGHRGVGKTSLLKRLAGYYPEAFCICLDEEIEKFHGPIAEIFSKLGEPAFREIEKIVFNEIYKKAEDRKNAFIAVGAGFEGVFPAACKVLWVQRNIDLAGFVFSDRPTLNVDKKNPSMPLEKFEARTRHYRAIANEEYVVPEGEFTSLHEEKLYFDNQFRSLRVSLTVLPVDIRSSQFSMWLENRSNWGVKYFELRDDLLSFEEILKIIKSIPQEKRLFSFRNQDQIQNSIDHAALCALIDWPLEFGEPPAEFKDRVIFSHHGEADTFKLDLAKMTSMTGPVKWSPVIESLQDLEKAHNWVVQDSARSLLPRSNSGKWAWYRLLQKSKQPLNFFREGDGSAKDQPTLLQWAQRDSRCHHFAAVLGSPVSHSWTPTFHDEFFKKKKMAVFAVDVSEGELNNGGLSFLKSLGFRAFAVTSPLKNWAGTIAGDEEPLNTLAWNESLQEWEGTSTDKQGFLALVQQAEILFTRGKNAVIWGGGGVLKALAEVLPKAHQYAAQNGRPRSGQSMAEKPSNLIWAGGDSIQLICSVHPDWRPERVIDLNYRGDSPGKAYAIATGARYYSGREMFFAQAEEQQKFWSRYEWK